MIYIHTHTHTHAYVCTYIYYNGTTGPALGNSQFSAALPYGQIYRGTRATLQICVHAL